MSIESLVLYRVVNHDPPIESDFFSHQRLGKPLFDPSKREMWSGVSMFGAIEDARAIVRPDTHHRKWIAELRFAVREEAVRIKRTGRSGDTHYTVWAEPEVLCEHVVRLHPVIA